MAELSLKDLWHACGGSGELRLLVEYPGRPPRGVVVETPFALLGSSDQGAVVLPDEQVSRRHACLQIIDGQLWCYDLVSRTGTFWGKRRKNAGWFTAKESLRIGPYQLRVFPDRSVTEGSTLSPFKPIPFDQDCLPSATLEFLNAQRPGSTQAPTFHLDRAITLVGQSPRCKIRFTCPTVSTCHCSFLRTPQGIWVIDLHSREGVAVNGAKVRWARLREGDCLGIGRFEVKVHVVPRRIRSAASISPMEAPPASAPPPAPPVTPAPAKLPFAEPAAPALNQVAPLFSESQPNSVTVSSALTTTTTSGALTTLCAENTALTPAKIGAVSLAGSGNDATQALLLTFFNQFSMMQQQMFDQFQQTTMMMMQMFGTLQRDQLQLVRQELDGLRDLNREIVSLQAELAKHQAEGRVGRRPPAPTAEPKPAPARPYMPSASAASASAARSGGASPTVPSPSVPSMGPTGPAAPKSPLPADSKAAAAAPAASAAPPDEDVHAWLTQRFNHLQQESQTRWQKLLATVVGH